MYLITAEEVFWEFSQQIFTLDLKRRLSSLFLEMGKHIKIDE